VKKRVKTLPIIVFIDELEVLDNKIEYFNENVVEISELFELICEEIIE